MANTEHLADMTLASDGWVDLVAEYPSLAGTICQIQVKSTTPVSVACAPSGAAPTDQRGHELGYRDALSCSAAKIWVKGKGAQIAVAKITSD